MKTFLHRVSGLTLRDRVRKVDLLTLYFERQ